LLLCSSHFFISFSLNSYAEVWHWNREEWRINFPGRAASSVAIVRRICFLFSFPFLSIVSVGHIAENCSSEQRLCYNCRQPGHESSACPSPRTVSAKQCYSCGGVGHIQGKQFPNVTDVTISNHIQPSAQA